MRPPNTQFADSPEGKIAYQVVGDGSVDLVYTAGMRGGNIDVMWDHPKIERFFARLASFSRLILCNPRGTGPSDPFPQAASPTFEEEATDIRWVLDAANSEQAAILGAEGGGWPAMMLAASYPQRTVALVLLNCFARLNRDTDYPAGFPEQAGARFADATVASWGTGENLRVMAPEMVDDVRFRTWYARLERLTMNPATVTGFARIAFDIGRVDLRGLLPSIKAPTLVISHEGSAWVRAGHGRYLADHIKGARYVERSGFWGIPWLHDVEATVSEIQGFLTGTKGTPDLDDRVLDRVLFTDIVGSTKRAAEIGDKRFRQLLDEHDSVMDREIERFRGRRVKSTGDGVLATFDGPARAIRCSFALIEGAHSLGIEIYVGLHTGEVEIRDQDVGGIAVNIAARVMEHAGADEILVSGSVPPLVAGSGIEFEDRGARDLKGVPGEWKLFAVKPR